MSRASTNTVQSVPPIAQRQPDPYWRKEVAQFGIDVAEVGESAAATGDIVSVDFRARTKAFNMLSQEREYRRPGAIADQFNVTSGQVLATVAGTTAWLPYEMALSRGVAQIDYPSHILLPSHTYHHDVFQWHWDRVYTLAGEESTSVLFGGHHGHGGWISCFSEEAPTQEATFCFAFSVPLSRSFEGSKNTEALIDAIGALPNIGQPISARLRELVFLRREEPDASEMSAGSLFGFYLALYGMPNLELPRITLTGDGNLYVAWKVGRGNIFSVQFLPENEARYALIRPDPHDPSRTLRSTGSVPADSVFKLPETSAARWAFK